jgi:putative DNA primase/helicase
MIQLSTKERARGRWRDILPALGIEEKFLSGHNCPCPICGGTDRFRFLDRRGRDGDGMWVCNQCQPRPRPAIDLAIAFTGKPFLETARAIDDILGDKPILRSVAVRSANEPSGPSYYFLKVWKRGGRIRLNDEVDRYLQHRGVGMDLYPLCLRTSPLDWHRDDETGATTRHPAMLAAVTNPAGKHVATHRTFLAPGGRGKANVNPQRKTTGRYGTGPTIRLMPAAPMMGIAEGIETSISAARLFNMPVWSVLCAHGIETFEPPPECQHLIVLADHDKHGVSQRAAEALKTRISIVTDIKMPDRPGSDWNDVLSERLR